jgi:hypothetical protein
MWMKKIRGRVLEIDDGTVLLLSSKGEYINVPRPEGQIRLGQEIEATVKESRHRRHFGATTALAVAAAIIFMIFVPEMLDVFRPEAAQPLSYVSLDINPSVELAFNEESIVVSTRALNAEGQKILTGLDEGAELIAAVEYLLLMAAEFSYFEPENNLVMLALVNAENTGVTKERLEQEIHDRLTEMNISGLVGVYETGQDAREQALQANQSLNRYLLAEAIRRRGTEIIDSENSLLELIKTAGPSLPGRLVSVERQRDLDSEQKPELPASATPDTIEIPKARKENTEIPVQQQIPEVRQPTDPDGLLQENKTVDNDNSTSEWEPENIPKR